MEYIEQKPVEVSPKARKKKLIILFSALAAAVVAITTAYVLLINLVFIDFNNIDLYYYSYRYDLEPGESPTVRIDSIKADGNIPHHLRIPNKLNGYPVTEIADSAFEYTPALVSVELPDTVTRIGKDAFKDCENLEKFNAPRDLVEIGTDAFDGTKWIDNQPSGAVVVGTLLYTYNGSMEPDSIIVASEESPEYSAGHTGDIIVLGNLSALTDGVFAEQENLVYAEIPEGFHEIKDELFRDCTGLEEVVLPNGLKTIGVSSFEGCYSLDTINFPNSIETIKDFAFLGTSITGTLELPTDLKTIGSGAFQNDKKITKVVMPYGLDTIPSSLFSGCIALKEVEFNEKEYDVDKSMVGSIGGSAFKETAIEEFRVPFNVETINSSAFANNTKLERVYVYNNLTKTYKNNVDNQRNVTKTDSIQGITRLDQEIFRNDSSFVGITLVDAEGNNLTSTSELSFPVTLKQLCSSSTDSYAFAATAITHVNFDVDYSDVADDAYRVELETQSFKYVAPRLFDSCTKLASIDFENNNLTSIYIGAFYGCTALNNVALPANLVTLGTNVFENNTALETITLNSKVNAIQNKTFAGCVNLVEITLPDSVKSIGEEAFSGCNHLTAVNIGPNSTMITIDKFAFKDCAALASFTMPNTVSSVGNGAFYGCTSLTNVTVSSQNSLKRLNSELFAGSGISSITLEANIWYISSKAFKDCANFEELVIKNELRVVTIDNDDAFANTKITATSGAIKVPASLVDQYKAEASWATFADRIVAA